MTSGALLVIAFETAWRQSARAEVEIWSRNIWLRVESLEFRVESLETKVKSQKTKAMSGRRPNSVPETMHYELCTMNYAL